MSSFLLDDCEINSSDPKFDQLLSEAYERKVRPLCLCTLEGVEMYISKLKETHFLKRMPGTGLYHHYSCRSFDPPAELSGLAHVNGTAIKEEAESDFTKIKVDFSLSRSEGRKAPEIGEENTTPGDVTSDPTKLTMRALLHYLHEQAGLNRIEKDYPGKRSWYYVRKMLLQAADNKFINGNPLSDILFIPETFFLDKKNEIRSHRDKNISQAVYRGTGKKVMMIVVGELKEITPDAFGYKIVLKHLPDFKFKITDDLHSRIFKKFSNELELWQELEDQAHLFLIGTFFVDLRGYATMESCCLQIADENWLIFESGSDKYLMNNLNNNKRAYIKSLRYNLNVHTPFSTILLTDTEKPTALYTRKEKDSDLLLERQDLLIKKSSYPHWIWNIEDELPQLPKPSNPN